MSENTTPPATPPAVISIDPAMIATMGKGLWGWFTAILGYVLMGLTSGYTTGQVLKSGIQEAIPKVPPIIKKLLPHAEHAEAAIGKIRLGNSGCTATIIGPVYSTDAKIDVLTAAHCVKVGAKGTMTLRDGRSFAVTCVSRDAKSDAAWLVADRPDGECPYLLLADELPMSGAAIFHVGFGVDRPGNKEVGTFSGYRAASDQCAFTLSVSPGDSGGAIVLTADNRVLSPVCCTTSLSRTGSVLGASPMAARKIRGSLMFEEASENYVHPILPLPPELYSFAI